MRLVIILMIFPNTLIAKPKKEKEKKEAKKATQKTARRKKSKMLTDDRMIEMLDMSLQNLPQRLAKLDPKIRRIAFYSLKVDRRNISLPLLRQIQGKIEAAILSMERPILVYSPELKPLKIVSKKNQISFISGFQSTEEIREISALPDIVCELPSLLIISSTDPILPP